MERSMFLKVVTLMGLLAVIMFLPMVASADKLSRATMLSYPCAGCHGTDGASPGTIPRIDCKSSDSILKAMKDYRDGKVFSTIMGRHVKGYTDEELKIIADFFGTKCSK